MRKYLLNSILKESLKKLQNILFNFTLKTHSNAFHFFIKSNILFCSTLENKLKFWQDEIEYLLPSVLNKKVYFYQFRIVIKFVCFITGSWVERAPVLNEINSSRAKVENNAHSQKKTSDFFYMFKKWFTENEKDKTIF
jgi:hypothetical protein